MKNRKILCGIGAIAMAAMIFVDFAGCIKSDSTASAQTGKDKPFLGYDMVKWGSTEQEVRAAYSIPESNKVVYDEEDGNIFWLTQENISDSIKKRQFLFNDGKLYRVWVTYVNEEYKKEDENSVFEALKDMLQEKYGKTTKVSTEQGEAVNFGFGYASPSEIIHVIYGNFAPDIEVELINEKTTIEVLPGSILAKAETSYNNRVCYTWKKFRDEYQAAQKKAQRTKIEL